MNPLLEKIDMSRLPQHIAVIMDGNGRWAKNRGNRRSDGHIAGVSAVRETIETASQLGIRYLTLYTFSTENWNRPKEEVDMLLALIVSVLADETENLIRNNVRLTMIGDMQRLPDATKTKLLESIEQTSSSTGLTVILALSYSSRWELTEAARAIALEVKRGILEADQIDESTVADHLTTASIPDPDLMIRTGGDERVSNFLLWQIAYSELYFCNVFWPDFDAERLYEAILDFQSRERRFGKTSEQIINQK
ncbi:MAG: isoprenyl transferase [Bacteroides sp.]|nr:isoprenyl transferase [Bacteroides sp.]MCM1414142.1 isoprenyl transferase [Bacteroides sp.]MCM1471008.1 isoprenyl transferase [Bacteroides sp.]